MHGLPLINSWREESYVSGWPKDAAEVLSLGLGNPLRHPAWLPSVLDIVGANRDITLAVLQSAFVLGCPRELPPLPSICTALFGALGKIRVLVVMDVVVGQHGCTCHEP